VRPKEANALSLSRCPPAGHAKAFSAIVQRGFLSIASTTYRTEPSTSGAGTSGGAEGRCRQFIVTIATVYVVETPRRLAAAPPRPPPAGAAPLLAVEAV